MNSTACVPQCSPEPDSWRDLIDNISAPDRILRPSLPASLGNMPEIQNLGPRPTKWEIAFQKIPTWFLYSLKSENTWISHQLGSIWAQIQPAIKGSKVTTDGLTSQPCWLCATYLTSQTLLPHLHTGENHSSCISGMSKSKCVNNY